MTPSAKLAMKVCELPPSETIAVTGLSEFVSRSYRKKTFMSEKCFLKKKHFRQP
jgi:hypothetical protein